MHIRSSWLVRISPTHQNERGATRRWRHYVRLIAHLHVKLLASSSSGFNAFITLSVHFSTVYMPHRKTAFEAWCIAVSRSIIMSSSFESCNVLVFITRSVCLAPHSTIQRPLMNVCFIANDSFYGLRWRMAYAHTQLLAGKLAWWERVYFALASIVYYVQDCSTLRDPEFTHRFILMEYADCSFSVYVW